MQLGRSEVLSRVGPKKARGIAKRTEIRGCLNSLGSRHFSAGVPRRKGVTYE